MKRVKKYEPIAWLAIGVAHDKYFVLRRWSMTRLYDFVGITFFSHDILKRHDCILVCLKYYCFYVNIKPFFESYRYEYSCHIKKDYMINMLVGFHIKNSIFINYLLEDVH